MGGSKRNMKYIYSYPRLGDHTVYNGLTRNIIGSEKEYTGLLEMILEEMASRI
jgi:hypothetical protein